MGRLVNDLLQVGSLPQQDVLGVACVCQRRSHTQRHLERKAHLPGAKVIVVAGIGEQAGRSLLGRDNRFQGLDRRPGHDRLGIVELLSQTVELIEHAQVQLRQQLVSRDQKLQLGDPDQKLLLDDVRLKRHHLSQAGIPVRLQPGLGRGSHGNDPPVVGRRQTQDVAQLSFRGDHVRGLGHKVEVELFKPLLGFGDVGDRSLADNQFGLFAIDDFAGELDGLFGAPELHVLLGQAPVLLLDRSNHGQTPALNRQTAASALSRAITIGARLASRPTGRPAA